MVDKAIARLGLGNAERHELADAARAELGRRDDAAAKVRAAPDRSVGTVTTACA